MSLLLEQLTSAVTPQLVGYLAKLTGETPTNLDRAIRAAVPTILSAMIGAARSPSAQGHLTRLIADPVNDGTLLHQLPALYQGTMTAAPVYRLGTQLLQSIFASKLSQATQTIGVLSSIKPASSALLVSTLAPHILAVIGQRLRSGAGVSAGNVAQMLEGEQAAVNATLPSPLANLFGAPSVKTAAASAAATVSSVRPGTTLGTSAPPSKSAAAAVPVASQTAPQRTVGQTQRGYAAAAKPQTGSVGASGAAIRQFKQVRVADEPRNARSGGLWLIFPVGLLMAAGAMGLWSLISSYAINGRDFVRPAIKAAEAPAVPTTPPIKTAEVPALIAMPPVTAATKLAVKPAAKPAEAPAKIAAQAAPARAAEIKAAAVVPPTPPAPLPLGAPGTTSFFGITKPDVEAVAMPNLDYIREREAAVAAAETAKLEAAKIEAAKLEVEKAEAAKLETEKAQAAKLEAEKTQAAKLEAEKAQAAKLEAEKAQAVKLEAEKAQAAKLEAEKAQAAKLEAEKAEAAKLEAEKAQAAKLEAEKAEAAKLEAEKTQAAKLEAEKAEAAKLEAAKAEAAQAQPVQPLATATGAAPNLKPCRDGVAGAVQSGQVLFQSARANLKGSSIATLNRIAAAFQSCPQSRLRVEGHTDNSGLADMNQKLSEARAQAVTSYLASKGIDAARISAEGFGATRPVAPNVGAANKMMNRRIEFIVDAL